MKYLEALRISNRDSALKLTDSTDQAISLLPVGVFESLKFLAENYTCILFFWLLLRIKLGILRLPAGAYAAELTP